MRKAIVLIAAVLLAATFNTGVGSADAVYHTEHIALVPVGGAPLRSGFVENIHADGPRIFALERYVLNGASPSTRFDVALHIWVGSTSCSGPETVALPTVSFDTNGAGNGVGRVALPPSAADGLHGMTIGISWTLSAGGAVAYRTSCTDVTLD